MPYLGRSSNFGVRSVFHYLPSAGDTSVSGADADGKTLAFADGNYIDVYLNGVKLKHDTDYNTNTANTVAGLSATAANDEVTVVVYDAFSLATGFETLGGTFGDDITFKKDNVVLNFGVDSDVTITHDPDDGLIFKSAATGDDNPFLLTLQTGETDIAANDVLGAINFQAPDEGTGTDAILVAAGIQAISEGDFSSSVNATSLQFMTGASETATAKASITSGGDVKVLTDGASIFFGADSEIELRHVADDGLILKHVGTGDGKEPSLTFQAGDNDIAANDVLGSIFFQAPDEGTGTDAILVAAGIEAVSEGDFSSSSNATSLVFKTGASEAAAEKVRITSGGNLGIGEDSPNSDLVVKQSGSTFSTASQTVALFQRNTATGSGCKVTILSGNNTSGDLNFGDAEDEDIGKISYEHNNNAMTFTTNTFERARFDSAGRFLAGSATSEPTNSVSGVQLSNPGTFSSCKISVGNVSSLATMLALINANGEIGSIKTTGTTTQFNTSSDYRLKENVVTDWDATSRLKQLKPSRFNFKADKDTTLDGFLAHEVSSIVPEAVDGEKDGMKDAHDVILNADGTVYTWAIPKKMWEEGKLSTTDEDGKTVAPKYASDTTWVESKSVPDHQSIDQSKLVPLLTKALQEAMARIETLEAKVTTLEGG